MLYSDVSSIIFQYSCWFNNALTSFKCTEIPPPFLQSPCCWSSWKWEILRCDADQDKGDAGFLQVERDWDPRRRHLGHNEAGQMWRPRCCGVQPLPQESQMAKQQHHIQVCNSIKMSLESFPSIISKTRQSMCIFLTAFQDRKLHPRPEEGRHSEGHPPRLQRVGVRHPAHLQEAAQRHRRHHDQLRSRRYAPKPTAGFH